MTDDLIARLATDLRPVPRHAMRRLVLAAWLPALVVSALLMWFWLGPRADLATAPGTMMFWTKFSYTLALAAFGGVATLALARPDGRIRWPWIAALALLGALVIGAFWQLARAEPGGMMPLITGSSNLVCPWYIVALSLPILAATLWALRRLAPTRPTLAGFATGLFSGGTGAWVYAFHCGENGMMFLALWYTLGILIVAALGAVLGRLLLRW